MEFRGRVEIYHAQFEAVPNHYTTATMMIPVGTAFTSINAARDTIYRALLNADLSWVVKKTDTARLLNCRTQKCNFAVRAVYSIKEGAIILRRYNPHTCSCFTHFNYRGKQLVKYLKEEYHALILSDRKTTPGRENFTQYNEAMQINAKRLLRMRSVGFLAIKSRICKPTASRRRFASFSSPSPTH